MPDSCSNQSVVHAYCLHFIVNIAFIKYVYFKCKASNSIKLFVVYNKIKINNLAFFFVSNIIQNIQDLNTM